MLDKGTLDILKKQLITQYDIEQRLNLTTLFIPAIIVYGFEIDYELVPKKSITGLPPISKLLDDDVMDAVYEYMTNDTVVEFKSPAQRYQLELSLGIDNFTMQRRLAKVSDVLKCVMREGTVTCNFSSHYHYTKGVIKLIPKPGSYDDYD